MKQEKNKKILRLFCVLFSVCLAIIPLGVRAVILYLEPSSGEYQPGDTFIEEIRINTEQECINTIKADLSFSQDLLEAVDFGIGNSILTLWIENPKINQNAGLISFIGGVPGGYCGRVPGDPGASNLLGKIIFKIKSVGEPFSDTAAVEFLASSQVLLNDGKGMPAELTTQGATIKITGVEPLPIPRDEWQEEIEKDKIPPEPFMIEVRQDPEIFEGKYYLVFSTTDKQTGLDHYKVAEVRVTGVRPLQKLEWKVVESPYLLEDQELQSIIKVKAVDKAGNERIVEVGPIKPFVPPEKKPFPWWMIVLVIVVAGAGYWLCRRMRRRGLPR